MLALYITEECKRPEPLISQAGKISGSSSEYRYNMVFSDKCIGYQMLLTDWFELGHINRKWYFGENSITAFQFYFVLKLSNKEITCRGVISLVYGL